MMELDDDSDGEVSISEADMAHERERAAVTSAVSSDRSRRLSRSLSAGERMCNGAASLCSKRFDEVAYATTHNSYNSIDSGFRYANHYETIQRQLEDGVRGFMLDLYVMEAGGTLYLCHGGYQFGMFCPLGKGGAIDMLRQMREWLERNPSEVITIILEMGATDSSRPSNAQVEAA